MTDMIGSREAPAAAACDDLREQIAKLAGELSGAESESADLQITQDARRGQAHRPKSLRPNKWCPVRSCSSWRYWG